jgi:restriction system protein
MTLWMVRAGKQGQEEDLALEHSIAVIGWWELGDLTSVTTREEIEALHRRTYPNDSEKRMSNQAAQVWAFRGRIEEGDLVTLPLKTRGAVAVGRVTGPYQYRTDFPVGPRHTRPVKWIKPDIPRSAFDQDLLYSLGAFLTVCQIRRNRAEERIRAMLGETAPPPPEPTPQEEPPEPDIPDLEQYASDEILRFMGEKFRGHDLARLVTAILEAQGYHALASPPGPDGGVDIMAGRGPMGFDHPRLAVQVKSSDHPMDVKVLRELQGVMRGFGAEQGLLVSWGGFKPTVHQEARRMFFELRLWDATKLVESLLETYEALPADLQAELPLKRIWTLVPEE